jgi:hypothetical protein
MREYLVRTSQKPRPLPAGRWALTQRWNDLLFVHWPVPARIIEALLPEWLEADLYQGTAWLGVVPFWLDRVKVRGLPPFSGLHGFPDLTLRTYVRDRISGTAGFYCFSMDSSSLLTVAAARLVYRLPYHLAEMKMKARSEREFVFYSRRRLAHPETIFKARYRGLGPSRKQVEVHPGSFESYMTERSCLFGTNRGGAPIRANLHYVPWPLEEAEAEIERNDLATAVGIELPQMEPVLHYSRRMAVYVWPVELVRPVLAGRPVTVAATPT